MGGGGGVGGALTAVATGGGSLLPGLAKAAPQLGQTLTGNSSNAGILGQGQFKAKDIDINSSAFNSNPANDQLKSSFANQLAQANARKSQQVNASQLSPAQMAQAAQLDASQQAQFRNVQQSLAQQLQNQANGVGPSLAQNQLRQGTDRNIAQAMAMQASQRGTNAGQGLRNIAQNVAQANQQAAADSGNLRLQEQQAAQSALGGLSTNARAQDIGFAQDNAGLQQQTNLANQAAGNQFALQQGQMNQQASLANQQAALQQQALNDAQSRFFNQGTMQINDNSQAAKMALEQLRVQQANGLNSANQAGYSDASQRRADFMGNLGGGIASQIMNKYDGGVIPGYAMGGEIAPMDFGGLTGIAQQPTTPTPIAPLPAPAPVFQQQVPMAPGVPMPDQPAVKSFAQRLADSNASYLTSIKDDTTKKSGSAKEGQALAGLLGKGAAILAASNGAKIPGKALVPGDNIANDTIDIKASPGEIMIPRSIADDDQKILHFVRALKAMPPPEDANESQTQAKIAKAMAHIASKRGA